MLYVWLVGTDWDDLRRMQAVHAADTRLWEVERSALVKSQSAAAAIGGNQSERPTTLGSGQSAAVAVDEGQLERSAREEDQAEHTSSSVKGQSKRVALAADAAASADANIAAASGGAKPSRRSSPSSAARVFTSPRDPYGTADTSPTIYSQSGAAAPPETSRNFQEPSHPSAPSPAAYLSSSPGASLRAFYAAASRNIQKLSEPEPGSPDNFRSPLSASRMGEGHGWASVARDVAVGGDGELYDVEFSLGSGRGRSSGGSLLDSQRQVSNRGPISGGVSGGAVEDLLRDALEDEVAEAITRG